VELVVTASSEIDKSFLPIVPICRKKFFKKGISLKIRKKCSLEYHRILMPFQ
jgi:hypothetical protein